MRSSLLSDFFGSDVTMEDVIGDVKMSVDTERLTINPESQRTTEIVFPSWVGFEPTLLIDSPAC